MSSLRAWVGEDAWALRFVTVYAALQLILATWDLPQSWSWEVDAVAPRELWAGLADNLRPGARHRYPLLQYLIIAIPSLPVLIVGLMNAESLDAKHLEAAMIQVPVMTGVSFVSKALTVVMGAIALIALARIARRLFSTRASRWALAFAVLNLSVGYYGRTNNLDVPYLMWTALAMDRLMEIGLRGRRRDYLGFAVFVGAAVGTKDQAYASIVAPGLFYLVIGPALWPGLFATPRPHARWLGQALGVGALSLGVLGGGLLNPLGFWRRFQTLIGPASGDFRSYERSWEGFFSNLSDLFWAQNDFWWPWPIVIAAWIGVVLAAVWSREGPARDRAWRLLPAAAALSSLVFFTLVVGRCEHRFVLPLGFWLALYAGTTAAWVQAQLPRLGTPVLLVLLSISARDPVALVLTQWNDARLEVEAHLAALPPGTTVEAWGRLPYLPRFSSDGPYQLTHVHSTKSARQRPPIPGATHLQAPYADVLDREPDVWVVPSTFIHKRTKEVEGSGRELSRHIARYQENEAVVELARAIRADQVPGYRVALRAEPQLPSWARALGMTPIRIHGSTGRSVWVLHRDRPSMGPD